MKRFWIIAGVVAMFIVLSLGVAVVRGDTSTATGLLGGTSGP